jgi:S1-C subfamily serine protease
MAISTLCPSCRFSYALPENLLGRKIRCTNCQAVFVVGSIPQVPTAPVASYSPRRSSKLRPPAPVAIPTGIPVPPQPERSSGISSIVLGGAVVAGVFALILVGGIALVLNLKSGSARKQQPAPTSVAEVRPPTPEPVEKPAPTVRETPPPPPPPPPTTKEVPRDPPVVMPADGSLAPEVLQKVKKATVYLRVTIDNNNIAQGSGFFAVEPGIVLTNAHVLGMLVGRTRRPQKVDVVLHSGETNERTLPGEILEVDRASDLAVLRVRGSNLPEPLPVHEAKNLQETQQVYVCGFPFGVNLGKEISVRKSAVASLRRENGLLSRVQLEGGMDPGNSGGPIIDSRGNVVGVAVAGIRGTTINFAIPGEKVHAILAGRMTRVSFGQPYRDGNQTKLPVTIHMMDPLGRIRQAGVDVWTGEPGQSRPGGTTSPAALPNDSRREQVLWPQRDGVATGEVVLPALPAGRTYWFQPVAAGASSASQWASALSFPNMPPPLERKPATLALALKAGSNQRIELACNTTIRMDPKGEDHTLAIDIDGQFAENTRAVDGQGTAAIRLDYLKMNMEIAVDGKPSASAARMQPFLAQVNQLAGDLRVDKQGNVVQNRLDLSKVPAAARETFVNVGDQVQQTLQVLMVPLPGGAVNPGQSWTGQRSLPIDTAGKYDSGIIDLKYTFLGIRSRSGRDEAVIALSGTVRPRPGVKQYINGKTTGTAVVDVSTGLVTTAIATVDVDLDLNINGQPARADGALEMKLLRAIAGSK